MTDDEITPEMMAAGADAVTGELGDIGGLFSPSDLATKVYRAMRSAWVAPCFPGPWMPPAGVEVHTIHVNTDAIDEARIVAGLKSAFEERLVWWTLSTK